MAASAVEQSASSFSPPEMPVTVDEVLPRQTSESLNIDMQKESDVGIVEFVDAKLPGFQGLLKKRYTDFLVNEILPSGQVVHLDDTRVPRQASKAVIEVRDAQHASPAQERAYEAVQDPAQAPLATAGDQGSTSVGAEPTLPSDVADQITEGSVEKIAPAAAAAGSNGLQDVEDVEEKLSGGTEAVHAEAGQASSNGIAQWQAYAGDSPRFVLKSEDEATLRSYFTSEVIEDIVALHNRAAHNPQRKAKDHGVVRSASIADRQLRTRAHQDIRRIFSGQLETYTEDDGSMVISAATTRGVHGRSWGKKAAPVANVSRATSTSTHEAVSSTALNAASATSNAASVADSTITSTESFGATKTNGAENSNTSPGAESQITAQKGTARRQARPQPPKLSWKDLGGEYLHFSLYKENKDTMEIIGYLGHTLRIPSKEFHFAGTKDRRAVTVQRVSARFLKAERLVGLARHLRGAHVGNYRYESRKLELGELSGNEFLITLRNCHFGQSDEASMEERLNMASKCLQATAERLNQDGFLNYFGMQRFGTFSMRTDATGMKILRGDFEGATSTILHYDPACLLAPNGPARGDKVASDDRARAVAIDMFRKNRTPREAIQQLPRKFSAEAAIIRHLGTTGKENDHLGALLGVSRNLRLMYVHAYQSLIWNLAASYRWKEYGSTVLEGDLVVVEDGTGKVVEVDRETVDADGEVVVHAEETNGTSSRDPFTRARPLSQEQAASGRYSICDVVLPMPGHDILYPSYMVKFYEDTMAMDKYGKLNPHDMKRPQRDFSLSGSYRKLVAKPLQKMTFEVRAYADDDEQFVDTDMTRLKKNEAERKAKAHGHGRRDNHAGKEVKAEQPSSVLQEKQNPYKPADIRFEEWEQQHKATSSKEASAVDADLETNHELDSLATVDSSTEHSLTSTAAASPDKVAVILKMQLGAGQYATMALRELMKAGGLQTYKPDFGGGR